MFKKISAKIKAYKRRQALKEGRKVFLFSALTGAVGAAVTFFTAKNSGQENRQQVAKSYKKTVSKLGTTMKKTGNQLEKKAEELRHKAEELREKASEKADELREKASDFVQKTKHNTEEAKEGAKKDAVKQIEKL